MILKVQRSSIFIEAPIKAILWLTLFTTASGFTLFLDGGARAQGMSNAVERTGLLKFVEVAFVPFSILLPLYIIFISRKLLPLRVIINGTGFRLAMLVAFMAVLQRFNGVEFSNAMVVSLVSFIAVSIVASLIPVVIRMDEIFSSLNWFYFWILAFSFYLVAFVPGYGVSVNSEETWQGVFSHKNNLGIFCATYAMALPGYWRVSKVITLINFALALVLVYGSRSYTAIGVFFLAFIISTLPFFFKKTLLSMKRAPLIASLLLSIALVILSIGNVSLAFFDKDFTFSGRSYIWAFSLAGYSESPIFGQGISSLLTQVGRNSAGFFNATGQVLSSHHNGFIAALYDLGVVGVVGLIWIFNHALGRFKTGSIGLHIAMCFLIPAILLNTFEERLLTANIVYFLAVLLISINEAQISVNSEGQAEKGYI